MRALFSYGVAFGILALAAGWLATGTLVIGGQGPGKGEKAIVSVIEGEEHGPIATALADAGLLAEHAEPADDPALTIAQRNEETTGAGAPLPNVRVKTFTAQPMPIEVPLRGRTKAKTTVSVVAQTSGIVQAVNVAKGQSVKAGDTLCTLDQGARKLAVEQAQAAVDQAQTAYTANQQLVQKGVAAPNTALAAEAALKGAQAQLENARLELERTVIKTDIDGVVNDPMTTAGAMLAMGQPCATVVQLDPMLFVASVPEAQIGYAREGLTAKVTTITGAKADGKVTFISSTADAATRSFPVEIEIPNPDLTIRDGVTADAIVNVGTSPVHVLPQSALTLDDEGVLGIRTVEAGSKVAFHPVTILRDTRDGVWVVGLPLKINVITVGQEFVQPGQIVDARTADGEPVAL